MKWMDVLCEGFVLPAIDRPVLLPDAVTIATDAVAEHLLHSEAVRKYIADLPKGDGTHCPDSPLTELVKYVAIQKGQIDRSNPALTLEFMEQLVMPVFGFEREQVLAVVGLVGDITDKEQHVFNLCSELGRLHDLLWAKWFAEVTIPYQVLDEDGKKRYAKLNEGLLPQYDYTVFSINSRGKCVNRHTWVDAFPDEIGDIVNAIDNLKCYYLGPELAEYWCALRNAYTCTEISLLESVWAGVDWSWIEIPSTSFIVPVHGMESQYEHPFCVSPEFRLEVRMAEAQECIADARRGTIGHARAVGLSTELVELASRKLGRIDVSVFTCAVRGGVSLNFRLAGQAVPNRQDVLAEGGKIFLNKSAPKIEMETAFKNLEKHCTPETAKLLKELITLEGLLAHTIDHEFSHPVGCTPESDKSIGDMKKLLEEGKATILGMLADDWRVDTEENRIQLVAVTVARVIRFTHRATMENDTDAAYVRENLIVATTLFEAGVMELSENGITVNVERAKSRVWFEHLKVFGVSVVSAYQAGDKNEILRLADRYCNKTNKPIADLIKWVNRN